MSLNVHIHLDRYAHSNFENLQIPHVWFYLMGINVYEPLKVNWQDIFSIIRENRLPLRERGSLRFSVDWWPRRASEISDEWIGARLETANLAGSVNTIEDYEIPYDPDVPRGCLGFIRGDRPIFLDEIPRTPIVGVGVQYIYRRSLIEALGGTSNFDIAEGMVIRHQGRVLDEYVRAWPKRKIKLFVDWIIETFDFVPCGHKCFSCCGIWVAKKGMQITDPVAEEITPLQHTGLERSVVLSIDQANALRRRFRSMESYVLEPIFREDSPTAIFAHDLIGRFQELRAEMAKLYDSTETENV